MPVQRGLPLPHVKAWRLSQALTQSELAEAAGMSRNTVRRAEDGEPIALANVRKIAAALGITVQQLLNEDPSKDERAA